MFFFANRMKKCGLIIEIFDRKPTQKTLDSEACGGRVLLITMVSNSTFNITFRPYAYIMYTVVYKFTPQYAWPYKSLRLKTLPQTVLLIQLWSVRLGKKPTQGRMYCDPPDLAPPELPGVFLTTSSSPVLLLHFNVDVFR